MTYFFSLGLPVLMVAVVVTAPARLLVRKLRGEL